MSRSTSGRSCFVLGCSSNSKSGSMNFFRVPTEPIGRDIFIRFSRRGSDFVVKQNHAICSDHFHPSCIKKSRLIRGAVPTIFKKGSETIEVTFDESILHYKEEDTVLKPANDKEDYLDELVAKRKKRQEEVLGLCRFCLSVSKKKASLLDLKKLKDYSIEPLDVLKVMELKVSPHYKLSDLVCEECFQTICSFDGFKKRCHKAENKLFSELKKLDIKIKSLQIKTTDSDEYTDNEADTAMELTFDSDDSNHSTSYVESKFSKKSSKCDIKEEAQFEPLLTNIKMEVFAEDFENIAEHQELPIEDMKEEVIKETDVKGETLNNDSDSDYFNDGDHQDDYLSLFPTDIYNPYNTSSVIQSEMFKAKYVFGCYFCKQKYFGRRTLRSHDCQNKILICSFAGCGRTFAKLCGYNAHIKKLHQLPKVSRRFCDVCKHSMVWNEEEFREHKQKCEAASKRIASRRHVDCSICGKTFENSQALSVHMKFHKEATANDKKRFICEVCGREYARACNLSWHRKEHKNIPQVPFDPKDLLHCDRCGKTRTNRKEMAKHLRCVHMIDPVACSVCGKVFKNKDSIGKHMIYHNESNRIHFCQMCPHRPPWFTAVALRRHQEANHGIGPGYDCQFCDSHFKTKKSLDYHKKTAHARA